MIAASIKKHRKTLALGCLFFLLQNAPHFAFAEQPFLTDDPNPTDLHALESYLFITGFDATHVAEIEGPAVEADYGLIPNLEADLIIPVVTYLPHTTSVPDQGSRATGLGDIELEFKYRFLTEQEKGQGWLPSLAIEPEFTFPSGNAGRNLGNGRLWYMLTMWGEKHFGEDWLVDAGGGYGINHAPGETSFPLGGVSLQHTIGDKLMLGAEVFAQGTTTVLHDPPDQDTGAVTLFNVGLSYEVAHELNFLFSIGHSISGTPQWISYIGFNYNINNLCFSAFGNPHIGK